MTKIQANTLSTGKVSNQRQGHHTPVMLVMSVFSVLRFVPSLLDVLDG